jgi:hypothetical protein
MTNSELSALIDERLDWRSIPGRMFWKVSKEHGNNGGYAGKEAGCIFKTPSSGYWKIGINGKYYGRSRLVFLMFNNYLPQFIDHKDLNRTNDHPDNLRAATRSKNGANRLKQQNNTSGIKGVHRDRNWRARIGFKQRSIHLGRFQTKEEASQAYQKAARELYGQFAKV